MEERLLENFETPGMRPLVTEVPFAAWLSPAMQAIESMLADIGNSAVPVLLTGEPGTGKEVIACRIHQLSSRRRGPLLKVHCSSVTPRELDDLFEEQLDGEGSPNGAAAMLTVILDEVSEMPAACQKHLAKGAWIADGFTSGSRPRPRVISTTCQNLEEERSAGRFADELYYRLSGVCLHLPPLRHRREDIPVLAEFFLDAYARLFGQPSPALGPESIRLLASHNWPGNVRELETVIRRVAALGDERALSGSLESRLRRSGKDATQSLKQVAREASRQAERELILKVLAETRWNRKRAAERLQISYKALLYKLKQIGLNDSAA